MLPSLIPFCFKDESEQLALTIGRVMEEASNKVDADMTNYAKRMKKTEDVIKKVSCSVMMSTCSNFERSHFSWWQPGNLKTKATK